MATYTGKPVTIKCQASDLFDRFSSMEALQQKIEDLPEDMKQQIGELRFDKDRLVIMTPQVGEVAFKVKERIAPEKVIFTAEGAPVPLDMTVNFTPKGETSTEVITRIDIDIPIMLKPMVDPHLQKAADKFGELMANLNKV